MTVPLEESADDIAEGNKTLGLKEVVLAGYSMGGPVALLCAQRHPDLVHGLVLCATSSDMTFLQGSRINVFTKPLMFGSAFLWQLLG